MQAFDTLTAALNHLREKGYTLDFNLQEHELHCPQLERSFQPAAFHIREFYRFEGETNPADMSVVYAIESDDGCKGVLVDAFGTYSDALSPELIAKLDMRDRK